MNLLLGWVKRHATKQMERGFTRPIAAALAVLAAVSLPGSVWAQTLKPFKFGISAPVVTVFPAFMASAHNLFEKHGLKLDIVNMEGGSRGIQVLLSGEIQAMSVGLAPVVQANIQGADVRAIASTANTIPITFFAIPRIKGPQDIKGANFGISTFGSETDIAISIAVKKWGMTRGDITISQVGGTTQRYNALLAGRLDVAPLLEPAITLAKQKGGFNVVLDLAAENTPWIFDSVVVTRDAVQSNADGIERFLKAYIEGAYLALSDADKAKAVISARWKTKDPVVIDATYASFQGLMPRDAAPSLDGARNVLEQLEAIGVKVKSRELSEYIDQRPLDALNKAGFIAGLQKQYGVK